MFVFAALIGGCLGFFYLQRPQPPHQEAVAFVHSVAAFAESRMRKGQPSPTSVQLRDLINGGHITTNVAGRFDGVEILLLHSSGLKPAPLEQTPEEVLIRVRLRDGRKYTLTADGSVHAFPR